MKRLALLAVFLALPACAHIDAIARDVEACVKADGPQALQDLERGSIKAVEDVLMCEADAPDPQADVPMCVESGLAELVAGLGPDGARFKECVVSKVETDPAAAPLAKKRAHAVKIAIIKSRNGR